MKALDYAIRTENWEMAALCLVLGAMEAMEALPADTVEDLLAELDVGVEEGRRAGQARGGAEQARAPTAEGEAGCGRRRHERVRGEGHAG